MGLGETANLLLRQLCLPSRAILYLHVRLKGLYDIKDDSDYRMASTHLIGTLLDLYDPSAILVPTFTYSFTKNGLYDRVNTPSEVGRFGEEVRLMCDAPLRSLNPVFSVVDVTRHFAPFWKIEHSAFGEDSLVHKLHKAGHLVVNINTPYFVSTYFHYIEYLNKVKYRYEKEFRGKISCDSVHFVDVTYNYYVRNLEMETRWDRDKLFHYLGKQGVLHIVTADNLSANWYHSRSAAEIIGERLRDDSLFMVKDT